MELFKNPIYSVNDLSNTFKILEADLTRRKFNNNDNIIFPLDFSEIYGYLFPEFAYSPIRKLSRLILRSKTTNINYGLFPPTIAEFFLYFFRIYEKIDGYSNQEKKIEIESKDISNFIMRMNPSEKSKKPKETMKKSEQYIDMIISFSDENFLQKNISNPCNNFKILIHKLKERGSLYTFNDIFPEEEERISFFKNNDKEVYDSVFNYICTNPGRNPYLNKRTWMEDYNRIDALLAHQSYILNKYYYKDTSNFFSIFTSSNIPSAAMEQQKVLFPELPFNNTPLYRDPIYLLCYEAYLENIKDTDELIETFRLSGDLFEQVEEESFNITNFSNGDINRLLNSIHILLKSVIVDHQENGLKQTIMDSMIPRFSRYKIEDFLNDPDNIKTYSELTTNLENYIQNEKDKYEEDFNKIQEIIKETLIELYLEFYPIIEDSDFFKISPKMMELKEKIIFG